MRYNTKDYIALVTAINKAFNIAKEKFTYRDNIESVEYVQYLLVHYLGKDNDTFVQCLNGLSQEE